MEQSKILTGPIHRQISKEEKTTLLVFLMSKKLEHYNVDFDVRNDIPKEFITHSVPEIIKSKLLLFETTFS